MLLRHHADIEFMAERRRGFLCQANETLLPAPDAGLGLSRLPHDRSRADPIGG